MLLPLAAGRIKQSHRLNSIKIKEPFMRVHYLQHVKYENLANMETWLKKRGHQLTKTLLYKNQGLPDLKLFDWLIIMGGPMNIYEHDKYPWLVMEKQFIKKSVEAGKLVLGMCLGAQLLSDSLGGKVTKNKYKEIGFFPATLTKQGKNSAIFKGLPDEFTVMHWHGDTFSIPKGAVRLVLSKGCKNQAFSYKERAFGLQFHFEYSPRHISPFFKDPQNALQPGKYVQSADIILKNKKGYDGIKGIMRAVLENLENSI
jgi:GMP synthase-like glutamine amidotransferase